MDTRLFFVVDGVEANEELRETLSGAYELAKELDDAGDKPRIRVCLVRNAYRDGEGWNYDDYSDTFETVNVIMEKA